MASYQGEHTVRLSHSHRRMLYDESGISPDVASERGYYTARSRSDVPEAFAGYQRRLGLVVPMFSPDGSTVGYQLRPDRPRKKGLKYETPGGISPVVDVHPRMLKEARHGDGPLLITEGAKTGDAGTSRGLCVVVLAGVWMWCVPEARPYRLKPCFDHIRLRGREVFVAFDSDCMTKGGVQDALAALVAALEDRGALVKVIYLPHAPDGSKQGIDDYLVAGGTIREMFALARKFDPEDLGRIRLSRDERLRAAVEDLERRWWAEEWKGMGGHSDRDVALKLVEAARRHGKLSAEGIIRVEVSWGTLEVLAKVSRRTLWKALRRLEHVRGFLRRDNEGRKDGKAGAFVLRATVNQYGGRHTGGVERNGGVTSVSSLGLHLRASLHAHLRAGGELGEKVRVLPMPDRSGSTGGLLLSAPRLRWSSPARRPLLGTVSGTRMVRKGQRETPRPAADRLGKTRGAVLDALEDLGRTATLGELAASLRHKRPRDLRRRLFPMLEEAGIITVDDGVITLAHNWLEALEVAREVGGEVSADELAEQRRKRNSRAYREWRSGRLRTSHHPANRDADGWVEELGSSESLGDNREANESSEAALSGLALVLKGYLERNPRDACQRPSWLGRTLWAFELVGGRLEPAEVEAAIADLGGDVYLRSLLERAA